MFGRKNDKPIEHKLGTAILNRVARIKQGRPASKFVYKDAEGRQWVVSVMERLN